MTTRITQPGQGSDEKEPEVTVVISTRNRGKRIVKTIRTILANEYPDFEVIVVDQSEDHYTETALRPFLSSARIRYIRTSTEGLSVGRNLGIRNARSEFIALTDDDCEVTSNWLRELVRAFSVDSRIGVVFGNVLAGSHDPDAGFITAYVRTEPYLARSIGEKLEVEGISGCMGIRQSTWRVLSGFDEMLGVGGPLKAGEESDFTIRALLAEYFVYEEPRVIVTHQGFFSWDKGSGVIHRNWYGTGASFAKQLKCGYWSVVPLLFRLAWRWAFGRSRVARSLGPRPRSFLRLFAFIKGFAAGVATRVDRATGHFVRNKAQDRETSHASGGS